MVDIIGIIAGAIIAIIVGAVVYYKTKKDTRKVKESLTDDMITIENASRRSGTTGNVARNENDDIIAAHTINLQEKHIPVADSLSAKVRRWHEDPNGSEVFDGKYGYYTEEN